jgi:hypothetical protein
VYGGKQGEETKPEQMDRTSAIITAEETPEPPELHRLVDGES